MVVSFLFENFIQPNTRSWPREELVSRLDDHLYRLREHLGETAFPKPAAQYLDEWASDDRAWLPKYYPPNNDEPHYDIALATEKVIDWLAGLGQKKFIGTESRLLISRLPAPMPKAPSVSCTVRRWLSTRPTQDVRSPAPPSRSWSTTTAPQQPGNTILLRLPLTNARRTITDGAVAAVGPMMSDAGKAMAPILSEGDLATITPSSTNPDIAKPKFARNASASPTP